MRFLKYCVLIVISALIVTFNSCDDDDNGDVIDEGITLDLVAGGLVSPLILVESPDNSGRLFVIDQPGQIYIIHDGEMLSTPFLDISGKIVPRESPQDERGLLGLAFHPDYESNGRFFVYYSGPLSDEAATDFDHTNRVCRIG
jgi:hypothetical protein